MNRERERERDMHKTVMDICLLYLMLIQRKYNKRFGLNYNIKSKTWQVIEKKSFATAANWLIINRDMGKCGCWGLGVVLIE